MKISLNKLRYINEYDDAGVSLIPDGGVDELVEKIGAQLGAVEEITDIGSKYEGTIIVKVVDCPKLEGSDHLSICKVDDGGVFKEAERDDKGLIHVVCGAPNVRSGMLAAWLPPGSTVPASIGTDEPFVLEARAIRGQKSNGMLASLKELSIGDDHSGILEVDVDVPPGTAFVKAYRLEDEAIIDIENKMFTHRPDCFGWLGIAREVAGIQGQAYKSPSWYTLQPSVPNVGGDNLPLTIKNELPKLVRRFTALTISNIKVGPSPVWLRILLAEVGIRSINNIVDYTNFYMLETGQPLHAYDYHKVKALCNGEPVLTVRSPKNDETVQLLNGKEVKALPGDIMIATDKQLIGLGGIMGGASTEVDDNTKNIILESGNFDMYSVRRSSMAHGLFTDAATRFTKGQSPLQNATVLAKIAQDIVETFGGQIAGPLLDDNQLDPSIMERGSLHPPVTVAAEFINARLGLELSAEEMKKILTNVEFNVDQKGNELTISAPFWRTDIELREDIVEEIGRLYGYHKLPLVLPRRDLNPAKKDGLLETKAEVRRRLAKAGANEVLTYSFVHGNLLEKTGQDPAKAFQLSNALSPDLQYYRMSLMPSLLDKVYANIKAGYEEFALFELGKTHALDNDVDEDGLPREFEFTALVVTAADKLKKRSAFYEARKYLEYLVRVPLLFEPISEGMRQFAVTQPYDLNRSAKVSIAGGDFLGILGEFKPSVTRNLKLPKYTAGFEVDTTMLQKIISAGTSYLPLLRFPGVKQDITLKVPAKSAYADIYSLVDKALGSNAPDDTHIQLSPIDIFQREDDPEHKQITFRIVITGTNRTLTDSEVNSVLDKVAESAKTEAGAERI